jgi:hypothetical protein
MKPVNTNDKWILRIGMTILLMEQFVGPGGLEFPLTRLDILGLLHAVISIVVIWLVIAWITRKVRNAYPLVRQSAKRIFITGLICLLVMYVLNIIAYATNKLVSPEWDFHFTGSTLLRYLGGVMLMVWIICGMYEAGYYQHLLRLGEKERNELLRLRLHHQLDELKNRVNPHFLFNSLNTLSFLIHDNSAKAERFVEELSSVYRYMLRNEEGRLTTLESEQRFIHSYIFLLKMRFGDALHADVSIDPALHSFRLPLLTLQVLTENALQHNVAAADAPLYVSACTENGMLVVKNNIAPRKQVLPSQRPGLDYILSGYSEQDRKKIEIGMEASYFFVRLPLLEPVGHKIKTENNA